MFLVLSFAIQSADSFSVNQTEYQSNLISDIIRQTAVHYLIKAPESKTIQLELDGNDVVEPYIPDLLGHLERYRMHHDSQNYSSQYFYAAYAYFAGVQLLLGLNRTRDHVLGLSWIQAAHRFGCNEATLLLAEGHRTGSFGLSESPTIAGNYYLELFHGWSSGTADVDAYQHNFPRYYVEQLLGEEGKAYRIPKAERQSMIISVLESSQQRSLYGNILAAGQLMGSFGMRKNSKNAARFAYLAALDKFKIKMDPALNSLEAVAQWLENEEEDPRDRALEHSADQEKENLEDLPDTLGDKARALLNKITLGLFKAKDKLEREEDLLVQRYESFSIPKEFQQRLEPFLSDFEIDGINLLQFNQTIPITPDAFYDALVKLCREVAWEVYQKYSYFKLFQQFQEEALTEDSSPGQGKPRPSKDQIFQLLLWTNQSLINQATRIFVDATDEDPSLSVLREQNPSIDAGFEAYYQNLLVAPQLARNYKETCSRKGQAYGLLSYFINSNVLVPNVVYKSNMVRALGRILNLGAAYYGCHMGLTGLAFTALDGYRPWKNPALNQSTFYPIQPLAEGEKHPQNSIYLRPEPKQALMALDIASQAGSFESSFFEALLLSHKLYEFSSKLRDKHAFLYTQQFKEYGYQDLDQNPGLARLLAEHSANAGHLGGVFLSGLFWLQGYGLEYRSAETGIARLRNGAQRVASDWLLEDYVEYEESQDIQAANYLVHAIAGHQTAMYNLLRLRDRFSAGKICMSSRKDQQVCTDGPNGWKALFIEIAAALGQGDPAVQAEASKLCREDIDGCLLAQFGLEGYVEARKLRTYRDFLRNQLRQQGELDEALEFLVDDYLSQTRKSSKFKKQAKVSHIYNNPEELKHAIEKGDILTAANLRVHALQMQAEKSPLARLVYQCYYDDNMTFAALKDMYPGCIMLQTLLIQFTGKKFAEFQSLTSLKSSPAVVTTHLKQKSVEYSDALLLEMALKYPDLYILQLFEFQNHLLVQNCNRTNFKAQPSELYSIEEVQKMLKHSNNVTTDQLKELHNILNNQRSPDQTTVLVNSKNQTGAFSPRLGAPKDRYQFCQESLRPQSQLLVNLLRPYLLFQCHKNTLLAICVAVFGLIIRDYYVRAKLQTAQNKLDAEPNAAEHANINDEVVANAKKNDEESSDLPEFEGGFENDVGQ